MSDRLDAFVVCTPGLEPLVATEIEKLGVRGPRVRHGGVDCSVTVPQLWSLNLRLRCATRVLVRLSRFPADVFPTLQAGLRRLDWSQWLEPGTAVDLKVASASSKLFHTGAVAERAAEVLRQAGFLVVADATTSEPTGTEALSPQVVHIRVTRDVVLVSLDSTGDPLYRRGWRLETAKAPLRETLAAALLQHSGWDRKAPLVDPFCGSGTIAIEAALVARRMAAGRNRSFTFERWPSFEPAGWQRMLAGVDADVRPGKATIVAADRDDGAIAAARANAERAGVADDVEFRVAAISDLVLPAKAGWVATNPPYGHRVGGSPTGGAPGGDLRDLYDRFGAVLRERAPGWKVGIVASEPELPAAGQLVDRLHLSVTDRLRTTNGGLPIELIRGGITP